MNDYGPIEDNDEKAVKYFDKVFFWDGDPEDVYIRRDSRYVISRGIRFSFLPGVLEKLEELYPRDEILGVVVDDPDIVVQAMMKELKDHFGVIDTI